MEHFWTTPETWWQWTQVFIMLVWMAVTAYLYYVKDRFQDGVSGSSLAAIIGLAVLGNFIPTDFQNDGILLYVKWRYLKDSFRSDRLQKELPLVLIGICLYVVIAWPGALFG